MTLDSLRDYCLSRTGATEELPFGPDALVFKVAGKMFALTGLDSEEVSVNLKCDPETAQELRAAYDCVRPGYHMNKVHWNTVLLDGSVPDSQVRGWIDDSYALVVKSLSKKQQAELAALATP